MEVDLSNPASNLATARHLRRSSHDNRTTLWTRFCPLPQAFHATGIVSVCQGVLSSNGRTCLVLFSLTPTTVIYCFCPLVQFPLVGYLQ